MKSFATIYWNSNFWERALVAASKIILKVLPGMFLHSLVKTSENLLDLLSINGLE